MLTNIGFLLFPDLEELDLVGPWEIFSIWYKHFAGPRTFTVSEKGGEIVCAKGLRLMSEFKFSECPTFDLLIVPGGWGTRTETENPRLIEFIQQRAQTCQQILSVCTGAFLLQKAGLLKDKQATTHWASLDRLRQFPEVSVVEQRFVQDGNIWTSAGVSAGIDMALAFIADIASHDLAANIQQYAEYYPSGVCYSHSSTQ